MHIYVPIAPTKAPEDIRVDYATKEQLRLLWEPIPCFDQNGDVLYYVVRYVSHDPMNPETVREQESQTADNQLGILLENLRPNTEYNVRVAGVTSAGIGIFSSPIVAATLGGKQYIHEPCCELFTWHDRMLVHFH